jgi:hypothetical protein
MKKNNLLLLVFLIFFSCGKEVLDRTIFIRDEDDRNLPAYTEWGYNSFGAEYERDYFLVSSKIIPCKISYNNNHVHFYLSGKISEGKEMKLVFIFPFEKEINEYKDLIKLHKVEIDLSKTDCFVKILQENTETVLDVIDGKLLFKRAQVLSVDDEVNRVILSGLFEVRFLQSGFPTTISNGRFDLGITKNHFYGY